MTLNRLVEQPQFFARLAALPGLRGGAEQHFQGGDRLVHAPGSTTWSPTAQGDALDRQRPPFQKSGMTAPTPALPADWLAHRYDPGHDAVHFIRADRALRRTVPFLTDENLPGAAEPLVVRREDALASAGADRTGARIGFVFHSAYCCSTLVANAYDRDGSAFSLKEPLLLNDLVGWRHRGGAPDRVGRVLADGLRLLARPFRRGETCVIKPSNVVNGLAPAMMAARPEAGALLLHAPLPQFLGSIANKGLWGRLWVRDLLSKQLLDGMVDLGFEAKDHLLQSDLQVAAVGWLAQHALFARMARAWPDRVRTLNSDVLLARPLDALTALDRLLGVDAGDVDRTRVIETVFSRNAKSGDAFTAADRRADQRGAAEAHADEIEKVAAWARVVAERAELPDELPAPLI